MNRLRFLSNKKDVMGLDTKNYSIDKVIVQAIQIEKLGYEFYMKMMERFSNNVSFKELFETLAVNELSHGTIFSELREKTESKGMAQTDPDSFYLRSIVESRFFMGDNSALLMFDRVNSIYDAVNYAIRFEKETLLYFYFLRDMVKEKEVVDEIIEEEKGHVVQLNDLKNNLIYF